MVFFYSGQAVVIKQNMVSLVMIMKNTLKTIIISMCLAFFLPAFLAGEGRQGLSLDFKLIIDGSGSFSGGKDEAMAWIDRELIDGILQEGDYLTIWSAGDRAEVVFSGNVGASTTAIKDIVNGLDFSARTPDFNSALREAAARDSGSRLSVIMLVSGSALAMAPSMAREPDLYRWSRVEEYSRWQVLVVAPEISADVRSAASNFMSRN